MSRICVSPLRPLSSLAFLLALFVLPGCHKDQPAERPEEHNKSSNVGAERTQRRIRVAAAADLKIAFDDLVAEFSRARPEITVDAAFGSSGNFFAQLSNKAPFDVFFSADRDYPRKLVAAGHADGDTEFVYAVGEVVVWSPKSGHLDFERLGISALLDPSVKKIAVANPKYAPYGRAAVAALKSLGVYDRIQDRLVFGENVAQAAQFVETGAADVGLIAHSLASSPRLKERGRIWVVPGSAYPKLEQAGVVLRWAQDRQAALAFCDFVKSAGGQAILHRRGFLPPSD